MGFIDWHGTKEDRYDEVVEFARMMQDDEKRQKDESEKKRWIAAHLAGINAGQIDLSTAMKLLVKAYRDATDAYISILRDGEDVTGREYLWEDFWLTCAAGYLNDTGIPADKQAKILQTLIDKVYRFSDRLSSDAYYRYATEHIRYRRYIKNCFSLSAGTEKEFWRWVGCTGIQKKEELIRFIDGYERFITIFPYYLYLAIHPPDGWQKHVARDKEELQSIRTAYTNGTIQKYHNRRLKNPLDDTEAEDEGLFRFKKILVFHVLNGKIRQDDEQMVEELYLRFMEGEYVQDRIDSILPEDIASQIKEGVLPVFGSMEISGLGLGEQVHFMNHAVIYKGKASDGEIEFDTHKGTVYFTNQKIMFRGNATLDIQYDMLEKVLNYGNMPSVLAVQSGEREVLIDLPDTELAYETLRLIVNPQKDGGVEHRDIPFTYEELVEKADLSACIFAFEYISANEMPAVLQEKVGDLLRKLKGLEKTIEKYPEKKDEIARFLSYYIPETIRVVLSYQQYLSAEIDHETLMNVHKKVLDSVETMDAAVTKKNADIYQIATMRTVAQADALTEILGQDGFSKQDTVLKH